MTRRAKRYERDRDRIFWALWNSGQPVWLSGYEIGKAARLRPSRVYPTLDRMMLDGEVTDTWGRPNDRGLRRRFYRVSAVRAPRGGDA